MSRFTKIVNEYDLWPIVDPDFQPLQEKTFDLVKKEIEKLDSKDKINILEIGCGTGITTKMILDIDPRINIVANDIDKGMTSKTKNRINSYHDRCKVITTDASKMNGFKNQFDLAISVLTFHNVEPKSRFRLLMNLSEKLKKGALFINADKIAVNDKTDYDNRFSQWMANLKIFKKENMEDSYNFWFAHEKEDDINRVTERQASEMYIKAGFKKPEYINRMLMYVVALSRRK